MFRRREDGSEELINEPGSASESSSSSAPASVSAPAAPSAPSAATPLTPNVATTPSAPAAASAAFRPVPPQAAMAAASRGAAPSAPSQPAAHAPSEPARSAAVPVSRPATAATKRVLTVGPDIQMKGEITSCDRVVIEGMVDATMRDVHTVELAETGALKGTAEVEDAEISGAFEGDLVVRGKLTVYASGRIRGNITYGEIEIHRGGQISGNIRNIADAKAGIAAGQQKKAA